METTTTYRMSDMIRHDLTRISESLPRTGQDHFTNLRLRFEHTGWVGVDEYCDIIKLYAQIYSGSNYEAVEATIISRIGK